MSVGKSQEARDEIIKYLIITMHEKFDEVCNDILIRLPISSPERDSSQRLVLTTFGTRDTTFARQISNSVRLPHADIFLRCTLSWGFVLYIYHTYIFYLFEMKIEDILYVRKIRKIENTIAHWINPTFLKLSFVVKLELDFSCKTASVWRLQYSFISRFSRKNPQMNWVEWQNLRMFRWQLRSALKIV